MVKMAGYCCTNRWCGSDQHGYQALEHLGIQRGESGMDSGWHNVAGMEPDRAQRWSHGHLRRGPIEVVIAGSGKGKSRLKGNTNLLIDKTNHTLNVANLVDSSFDLATFLDAASWLNEVIGPDSWCYEEMVFHFESESDLVMFKLRYLGCYNDAD